MEFDQVLLSRIQFAFTISFHIVFPTFTIGLASFLAVIEGLWLKTKIPIYQEIYKFWVKIFAVTFGMGVVSGVVMSYQFGTNWSNFSDKVGNVLGPLLGFEVFTAFFLESSFLGIMLFGFNKVTKKVHFISTLIVAIGTIISAFWILAASSWMHTPAGFELRDEGFFYPLNWLEIIFNPSFPYRFFHMITASYLTTSFVIGGVASFYLLNNRYKKHAKIMLFMAVLMALIVSPIQIFIGDLHGLNTLKYQPVKVSAIEGIWNTEKGASFNLIGLPDKEEEKTKYAIEIPYASSLILTHSLDGEVKGLKEWTKEERPPVAVVFFSFRIMLGIGCLMVFTGIAGLYLYLNKRLYTTYWFQYWYILMSPSGFIAVLAGWLVTEVGRQPYIVYNILKTVDTVSPLLGKYVFISLIAFVVVYLIIFGVGIYYIIYLIKKGIEAIDNNETYVEHWLSNRL
ncbi:cytochrome ubiquinol oxidase subunit I [Rickettsia prowazekii]|uniref:cytochrome ubiquinol oxidase subunit I n=1 Tax=Rickettsia prowazekii TaxID=782 RepID=UPI0002C65520|nr:cytochrome ubiquinol oxidase subunit I [Rickettsia prowazekii]AGJ02162.1 Cytochrome D ubiquinol oxidase subunit 1 [Rickettsia prowazekii str. NMRC Madrid E]